MPNGKPGDHPFTDILVHGHSEFGEAVDSLVKKMAASDRFFEIKHEVADLLWEYSPAWRQSEKESLIKRTLEHLKALNRRIS